MSSGSAISLEKLDNLFFAFTGLVTIPELEVRFCFIKRFVMKLQLIRIVWITVACQFFCENHKRGILISGEQHNYS